MPKPGEKDSQLDVSPAEAGAGGTLARPEPAETGTAPGQASAGPSETTALVASASAGSFSEFPLSGALEGIGEIGIRGRTSMILMAGHAHRIERDLAESREEVSVLRAAESALKDKLAAAEQRNAVLVERLDAAKQIRRFRAVTLSLGGIVAGVSVKAAFEGWRLSAAIPLGLVGALLLATGWGVLWPDGKDRSP